MQVGDLFDGRYSIVKILGQGGMGTVYLARNINTETFWAIKEICKKEGAEVDWLAEPKLLKKLEHPALPRLFDILEQDGRLYMVSDYIDGMSLDKKLESEGKIAEEIVVDWAIQLCKALEYLHSLKPNPIIYRDMKPSNIILTGNGILKLVDFGIAREYKPQSAGDTVYIGTRGYAAPEQYGTGQTSAASDIYSLGVTLHHLLSGKNPMEPPFGLKPIRYFEDSLSSEMEAIILKCTRDDASERYQNVLELLKDLEVLQDNDNIEQQDKYESIDYGMDTAGFKDKASGKGGERAGSRISIGSKIRNGSGANTGSPGNTALRQASFKKLVITVWDNAEFGCELACMAAKYTQGEVLLADIDLLSPKADLFLNLKKYPSKFVQGGIFGHSGLDMVMDAIGKGSLTTELLKQATIGRKDLKNLHVLTGNYRLENYEYYSEGSVPQLIDKCYRSFDITILLVNKSIYDAFTLAALLKSDINIAAIRGDVDKLREFNTYIAFLKEKQRLPLETTKFILFEYDKTASMPMNEAKEATQGNLLGAVSISKRRTMYRNLKGAYAVRMEKEIINEYVQLLVKLGLMPATGVLSNLRFFIGRLKGCNSMKSIGG